MSEDAAFQEAVAKFAAEGKPAEPTAEQTPTPEKVEEIQPPRPVVEGEQAEAPPPEKSEPEKLEEEFVEFSGKQKERFNSVYGRMRQLERENAALRQAPPQPRQEFQPKPVVQPSQQFTEASPKLADFDDADKWGIALSDWSARKTLHETRQAIEAANAQERQRAQAQQQYDSQAQYENSKVAEGNKKYGEHKFTEYCNNLCDVIPRSMIPELFALERYADVTVELSKNLQEAERIAALPQFRRIYELQRLEASMTQREELAKKQQQQTPAKVEQPGSGQEQNAARANFQKLKREALGSDGDIDKFAALFKATG